MNENVATVRHVIIVGLLSSIARAISRSDNDLELAVVIEKAVVEKEIKDAWFNLFSHFKDIILMTPGRFLLFKLEDNLVD